MNKRFFLKSIAAVFGFLLFLTKSEEYKENADDKIYTFGSNHVYLTEMDINGDEWKEVKKVSNPSYSIVGTQKDIIKQELDFLLKNFVNLKYSEKDENFQKELDELKKQYRIENI